MNQELQEKLKARIKNGSGAGFLDNGDLYSGQWKSGKRDGHGSCKFYSGGYYKGEWSEDKIHGVGILALKSGLIIQGKFTEQQIIKDSSYQIFVNFIEIMYIQYANGEFY